MMMLPSLILALLLLQIRKLSAMVCCTVAALADDFAATAMMDYGHWYSCCCSAHVDEFVVVVAALSPYPAQGPCHENMDRLHQQKKQQQKKQPVFDSDDDWMQRMAVFGEQPSPQHHPWQLVPNHLGQNLLRTTSYHHPKMATRDYLVAELLVMRAFHRCLFDGYRLQTWLLLNRYLRRKM
jgi:hypothetical protein